jgi:hypothetical protein
VTVPLSLGQERLDDLTNDLDTGSSNHHFWYEESSWTEFWCSYRLVDCQSRWVVPVHGIEDPSEREAREARPCLNIVWFTPVESLLRTCVNPRQYPELSVERNLDS